MKHKTNVSSSSLASRLPGSRSGAAGTAFALFLASALHVSASTTWIGGAEGDPDNLANAANWSNGVPSASLGAVFPASGVGTANLSAPGNFSVSSMLFGGSGTPVDYSIAAGGEFQNVSSIVVEAGAGAVTINPHSELRFNATSSGLTNYITNHSANLLTINGRLHRSGSHTMTVEIGGSGDVLFTGGVAGIAVNNEVTNLRLSTNYGGTTTVDAGLQVRTNSATRVQGGTLVMDGDLIARGNTSASVLIVGDHGATATLTGNGRIGVQQTDTSNLLFTQSIRDRGIVNPGRVGEVGALTFANFDLSFQNGSALHLDLLNPNEHDQLLFAQVDTTDRNKVPAVILTGTVNLELNFLGGAPVLGEYTILSGYSAISAIDGETNIGFAGWENGTARTLDGYEGYLFILHYGTNATTLEIIPEPSTYALIAGLGVLGILALRRRKRS